jgi:hypothetical protein
MNPIPAMTQDRRDNGAVRRAAMLAIDEFGDSAVDFAETRAIAL